MTLLDKLGLWKRKLKTTYKVLFSPRVKIVVGASGTKFTKWISTEEDVLDITKLFDWKMVTMGRKIKNVLAEHVLEHLTMEELTKLFENISRCLENGGVFRMAVPDGYHPSRYVIDLVKPNGLEPGAEDHKVLFNIDLAKELGKTAGLIVKPLEYFDSNGKFHYKKWQPRDGYVSRSSKNYKGRFTDDKAEYRKFYTSIPKKLRRQFETRKISYTSLIVDFVKP